jgi:hypothetical protein
MVAKAWVIPKRPTAPRAPPLTAPTADSVQPVQRSRVLARPEMPTTTIAHVMMTMMRLILVLLVAPVQRWALAVIALGNPHAPRSPRLFVMGVPAELLADDVFPALVSDNVETKWQLSRNRLAAFRIFSTALWLPSPVPPLPSLPHFAPRFLQTSPVPAHRLWQPRQPPLRLLSNPLLPQPPQPLANLHLNNLLL